jgi:hypothetical protein
MSSINRHVSSALISRARKMTWKRDRSLVYTLPRQAAFSWHPTTIRQRSI